MDQSFIDAITHNHFERLKLLDKVERAQSNYRKRTNRLMRRVDGDTTKSPEKAPTVLGGSAGTKNKLDQGHGENSANEEPEWDKLIEAHEPNRNKVNRFLRAREMKNQADLLLNEIMEEVDATFQDIEGRTTNCIWSIMDKIEGENMQPLEATLKDTIVDNHARRQENRQKLEETDQAAENFFTGTMAKLQRGTAFLTSALGASSTNDEDVGGTMNNNNKSHKRHKPRGLSIRN